MSAAPSPAAISNAAAILVLILERIARTSTEDAKGVAA